MQIAAPLNVGSRAGDADTNASLNLSGLVAPLPQADGSSYTPNMVARIAGYSAELLDRFLDKLGKPVGVPAYKPCNSVGEPYLPNYLGMLGIPIDLVPEFPTHSPVVLLTAASRYDPDLVPKVKKFVQAGGRAIATTGLIEALGEKGFQDIVEVSVGGRRVMATRFSSGRFGGSPAPAEPDLNILLPQIRRLENDNRLVINYETALSGYPLAISSTYGQGTFCVVAIPDDFADLYRLPQNVLNQLRSLLCREMFVRLDAPHHVSLFAYDNHTFIVQNFQPQPVNTRVSLLQSAKLHDLLNGQTITSTQNAESGIGVGGGARGGFGSGGPSFAVPVPAHSFRVFAVE
jgi:hypothetical protein